MKTPSSRSPVEIALAAYGALLGELPTGSQLRLPPERELALRWGLSQSAVNRASLQLVAAGRLRREGYKLIPVAPERDSLLGARVVALTHRALRFPGLAAEAVRIGVNLEELFFTSRDTLRHHLREAAVKRVDGVILRLGDGGWEWDAEISELTRLHIPCVVCEEAPQGLSLAAEDWRPAGALLTRHLAEKGHVHLAFFGSLRRPHRSAIIREAYVETCLRLNLANSAECVVESAAHTTEAIAAAFARIREQWPQTTALVLYDADSLASLLEAIRVEGMRIPSHLSIVAAGDHSSARGSRPDITCAGFDQRALGQLALDQICHQIIHLRRFGRAATCRRLRLEPVLIERASVKILAGGRSTAVGSHDFSNQTAHTWSQDRDNRLREVNDVLRSSHRLARDAATSKFCPLDLTPLANRSVTRQNSWLGHLPLLHLATGRQVVHGVPFDVIDERKNDGLAAVVLRSQRPLTQDDQPLPLNVTVPAGRKVRAVYFLHGCGYVSEPMAFAWYDFVLQGRRTLSVPLVARGLPAPNPDSLPPNIQDWWSDFPQFEAPGVKHAVVTANGDPFDYERYLYTLEWENPHPQHTLREIRISANPSQPTTLGVLAITLLLA